MVNRPSMRHNSLRVALTLRGGAGEFAATLQLSSLFASFFAPPGVEKHSAVLTPPSGEEQSQTRIAEQRIQMKILSMGEKVEVCSYAVLSFKGFANYLSALRLESSPARFSSGCPRKTTPPRRLVRVTIYGNGSARQRATISLCSDCHVVSVFRVFDGV